MTGPSRVIVPSKLNGFRNRGFDDGERGRAKLTEFPDDACRSAYLHCYRRGVEKSRPSGDPRLAADNSIPF